MPGLLALMLCLPAPADLPPVHEDDARRFNVPAAVVEQNWRFACAHCDFLDRVGMGGTRWHAEACHLKECWDQLDNVKRFWVGRPELIRQSLERLRTLLGPECYELGLMPPHVPVWRFVER